MNPVQSLLGRMDIYLADQIQRGNVPSEAVVLDAGCGGGRNLDYFFRQGHEVLAADEDEVAVARVRERAARLAPGLSPDNFRCESVETMSFPGGAADLVISCAVLHFARTPEHFRALLEGTWRVLKPGGLFFCRTASSIGIEASVRPLGDGRYRLPDGSDRFLADETLFDRRAAELGAVPVDPLKTTVVANQRSMSTWVLRRPV